MESAQGQFSRSGMPTVTQVDLSDWSFDGSWEWVDAEDSLSEDYTSLVPSHRYYYPGNCGDLIPNTLTGGS